METDVSVPGALERIRRAVTRTGRRQAGGFVVEGIRHVERALRAGWIPSLAVVDSTAQDEATDGSRLGTLLRELEGNSVPTLPVTPAVFDGLCQGRRGSKLVALCPSRRPLSIGALVEQCQAGAGPLLVLVDVEDPGNVGALVRTALAAGASGLIAAGVSDPFHPKAVRTSMGSIFKLAIGTHSTEESDLAHLFDELGALRRVAAVSTTGAPPWSLPSGSPTALVIGSEARGLPGAITERVEYQVSIPMRAGVDSYSVNAAAAVLLYELTRPADNAL